MKIHSLFMSLLALLPLKSLAAEPKSKKEPEFYGEEVRERISQDLLKAKEEIFEPFEQITTLETARIKFAKKNQELPEEVRDLEFEKRVQVLIDSGMLRVDGNLFHSSAPSRAR